MKKRFSVFFILTAFVLTLSCFFNFTSKEKLNVYAYEYIDTKDIKFDLKSKSAFLMDCNTKTVIYQKDEKKHLPIASMCKIMTLLLAYEEVDEGNVSLSDDVIVSENASGMGGSQVFLESNATYKLSELLKSITVASANDASVAVAEFISGSEDAFVDKMNEKAKELNMQDSFFVNCTGLPKVGQYSCAHDVAIMFSELIKHKDYFNYSGIWMDEISHPNDRITEISNTNKLIRFYEGCDSGKTGFTQEAGHCICASAMRKGMRLISVVISAPDSKTRFKETSEMFNYGFANFTNKLVIDNKKPLNDKVSIVGGKESEIEVVPERPFFIFTKKDDKTLLDITLLPYENLKAPIKAGDVVGQITIYKEGMEIITINALAFSNVEKIGYFDSLSKVIENWGII